MAYEKFFQNLNMPGGREYINSMAGRLAKHGMPEGWVMRQLNQESGGKPNAKSKVGAMGVAQMMPDTWNSLKRVYPKLGLDDPWDPKQSLKAYEALMTENLKRTKGDPAKAVQGYHGGWNPKNYGPENRDYINIVSGRKVPLGQGVSIRSTPQKQDEMAAAYAMGIGAGEPSVQQAAAAGLVNPIQYTSENFWKDFQKQDPLQGQRNYALNPITFESLAGYV